MKTKNVLATAAFVAGVNAQEPLIPESQWGNFAVINHCSFDIYLWSVAAGETPGPMVTLPANSPQIGYKEQYRTTPIGGGISLKASPNYGPGNSVPSQQLTQLEYTVPSQTDPGQAIVRSQIFYDISWVNGNPFDGIPMTMQTSNPNVCTSGQCGAGIQCNVGYEWATDDSKTHSCGLNYDVIWTFCSSPGGSLDPGVTMGALSGRDVKETVVEKRAPQQVEDEIVVCVEVINNVSQIAECTETETIGAAPTPSPSAIAALQQGTTTTSAPPPPPTTTSAPPPPPTTTSTSTQAPAASPEPAKAPSSGAISFAALTDLQQSGVTEWLSFNGQTISKREIHEHHAHRHNHQAFHRRNRIIKKQSA